MRIESSILLPPLFMRLGVIILAAGQSVRMGQPKLLLPWQANTILGHVANQWKGLDTAQMAVVYSNDAGAGLTRELDALQFPMDQRIENPDSKRGMFSSILRAAQWTGWQPGLTHWAIVLGDQPLINPGTLRELLEFSAAHPAKACQPQYDGRPKHPVILPRDIFIQLPSTAANDLKTFLVEMPRAFLDCEDPGVAIDIDYPEDYERAKRQYFGPHS